MGIYAMAIEYVHTSWGIKIKLEIKMYSTSSVCNIILETNSTGAIEHLIKLMRSSL
jgi:hypothetical protein